MHMNNSAESSCMSDESSWELHIANFLASYNYNNGEMSKEALSNSSFSSGFSSSFASLYDGGDASFVTSELLHGDGDDDDDDSLQDTACSSAIGHKVVFMNNSDARSTVYADSKEIIPQEKCSVNSNSNQEVMSCDGNSEKKQGGYEYCNELRKKGLCLVPLSMLIDYLG